MHIERAHFELLAVVLASEFIIALRKMKASIKGEAVCPVDRAGFAEANP